MSKGMRRGGGSWRGGEGGVEEGGGRGRLERSETAVRGRGEKQTMVRFEAQRMVKRR